MVSGWVGLGGNGEWIRDLWLLCGIWAPVHKLRIDSGESDFYKPALIKCCVYQLRCEESSYNIHHLYE